MTAVLTSTARSGAHALAGTGTRTRRLRGSAPLARPHGLRPQTPSVEGNAPRRRTPVAACRVTSPAVIRENFVLKVKLVAVAALALVGTGVSVAEFASWSEVDPAVEFVAGDPAWSHVTDR